MINTGRIMQVYSGGSNEMIKNTVGGMLEAIFPFNWWLVVVYDDTYGTDNHYLRTENGFVLLHYASRYNILVSRADKGDTPQPVIENSPITLNKVG
jgi:hypothetical protein